jgi:hypothetical protein
MVKGLATTLVGGAIAAGCLFAATEKVNESRELRASIPREVVQLEGQLAEYEGVDLYSTARNMLQEEATTECRELVAELDEYDMTYIQATREAIRLNNADIAGWGMLSAIGLFIGACGVSDILRGWRSKREWRAYAEASRMDNMDIPLKQKED